MLRRRLQRSYVMRIFIDKHAPSAVISEVVSLAGDLSGDSTGVHIETGDDGFVVSFSHQGLGLDKAAFEQIGGVTHVEESETIYRLSHPDDIDDTSGTHAVEIPRTGAVIGGNEFVVMAGPCAVEETDKVLEIAEFVKTHGAKFLRGGAFKPRTSPYSFQGLGEKGLEILKHVGDETGIGIVTEAMEPGTIGPVSEVADIIQIGSRNMQNFPLLKEAGRQDKPVLLKRGMSATLEEWLGAAEYVLSEGNTNVILCERGIRTFSRHSRHTLDIGVIPVIRERCNLPVIIDPSHATGASSRVPSMARAAAAGGADGLLIEVHPSPSEAKSDGFQSISFSDFQRLMGEIEGILRVVGRGISITSGA